MSTTYLRKHAYLQGRAVACQKLGFDTEEQALKDLLVAQIQDEIEGVQSYEDLATTARDAGEEDIAKLMEENADEEGHHAHENTLALKEAARRLVDPSEDAMFYGDDSLPVAARQYDLQRELAKIQATSLPERAQYQRESGRTGGIGGGVLGGLAGAGLGMSGGPKGMLLGGLAGAAGGGGLGYLMGRGAGAAAHGSDQRVKSDAQSLLQDPVAQRALLHRAKTDRDEEISARQHGRERALAELQREQIHHNFNYGGY